MRVLFVTYQWNRIGGLEAVSVEVANALRALGATLDVLSVWDVGAREREGHLSQGLAPSDPFLFKLYARWLWRPNLLGSVARIAKQFDLILVGHAHLLRPVRLALEPLTERPRVLLWAHGLEVWGPAAERLRHELDFADHIAAVSQFTADQIRAVAPRVKLSVIPNPVNTDQFRPGKPGFRERNSILIVGRLSGQERYKGHQELMEAMTLLPEAVARGVELRIAGDGDDRLRLEKIARELGLNGRVRFLGRVDTKTLIAEYQQCSVFAMPSRVDRRAQGWTGEGFGLVYVEAAACGRPVIASSEGGAPETVVEGKTGLLVDPRSPREIAGRLQELLSAPALAKQMGEAGRAWATEQFSVPVFQNRIRRLLSDTKLLPR